MATVTGYTKTATDALVAGVLPTQTSNSGKFLTTNGTVASWATVTGGTSALTPTATKTATYTAAVGDLAMMNVPGGATTLTLPTAPANKSQVGYRAIGATAGTPLIVNRGGSDTIGTAGATSATIALADEVTVLQYDAPNTRWLAVSNVKTQASLDSTYAAHSATAGFLTPVPVGTGTKYSFQVGNATSGNTNRTPHHITQDVQDLRLVFGNFKAQTVSSGTAEDQGTDTYTVRAAVEWGGVNRPVTFRGSRSGTVEAGGLLVSDPLSVEIPAGSLIFIRTYATSTGTLLGNVGTPGAGGTATGDLTAPGAAAITTSFIWAYAPVAIFGTPTATAPKPAVAMVGDSIGRGTNDNDSSDYAPGGSISSGFFPRALNRQYGFVNAAWGSETAQNFLAYHQRLDSIRGVTHAVCQYGRNDLDVAARTAAQLESDLAAIWLLLARRGMSVYQTTIVPWTTSTDAWATTGNQTLGNATSEGYRVTVNTWLRAGAPVDPTTKAPVAAGTSGALLAAVYDASTTLVTAASGTGHPLRAVFELADTVESARDSGKWKTPGYTADGIHPSSTGHTAMAASIKTSLFT